jgi:hypothetical protein
MVDNSHMTIIPGDRDRVPTLFGDSATISGIASPVNASALLEVLRFGGGHIASPLTWVAHISRYPHPALRSIPIIAVTSHALTEGERKARDAGCDDFVAKPYSPRQLIAKIRQYLTWRVGRPFHPAPTAFSFDYLVGGASE